MFENTYTAEGSIQFYARKDLVRRELKEGEFRFKLFRVENDNGTEKLEEVYPNAEFLNDKDGLIKFNAIKYDEKEMADAEYDLDDEGNKVSRTKTIIYRLKEVIGTDPTVIYDTTKVPDITVTLVDDLEGKITATAVPDATKPEQDKIVVTFTNIVTKIQKVGKDLNGKDIELSNAYLEVWGPDDEGKSIRIDGWKTTAGEAHEVKGLKTGVEYTLKETVVPKLSKTEDDKSPERYYRFADDTTFTVDENGKITYSTGLTLRDGEGEDGAILLHDKLAEQPKFEKKIKDTNDTTGETSEWIDSADYDIGDAVPYRLTATLADNVTDYKNYHITFKDHMETGLTFNGIEKVTVNGTEIAADGYELTSGGQNFELTLTWKGVNGEKITENLNKAVLEVYFTAILNENAVLGSQGNVNTASLIYSCNPNVDENGKLEEGNEEKTEEETEEDSVIAFTYKVVVNKVDETGLALAGAEFELYKLLAEKDENGEQKRVLIKCVTADSGDVFTFNGLDDGDYELVETKHPEGYLAIDPITFTVTADHEDEWNVTNADEVKNTRTDVLTSLTGGNVEQGELPLVKVEFTPDIEAGSLTTNIQNESVKTFAAVKKIWVDGDNRDNTRKDVTVYLVADGEKTDKSVTLTAKDNWMGQIKDLPKMKNGKPVDYTWSEEGIPGYTLTKTEHVQYSALTTLTNTYGPAETEVTVTKKWVDNGTHPTEVKVQLYADGRAIGEPVTLSESNNWSHTWTKLAKYTNPTGSKEEEIEYKVAETEVPEGYVATITGNGTTSIEITNTLETGKLVIEKEFAIEPWEPFGPDDSPKDIPVYKIWNDDNNKYGNRPETITVRLWADGEEITSAELNEKGNWRTVFTGLPRFREVVDEEGKAEQVEIVYTITEDPVEGYETEINGFNIRNTYIPELTSVTVRKVWDDNNNAQQKRPSSIAMTLSNGMIVILDAANHWTATIDNLPTKVNGQTVTYTWTEQTVLGYNLTNTVTEGDTTTFTNTFWERPETPTGSGKKPKTAGNIVEELPEYETPLGVEVIINHVGDCFD